MKTIKEKDIKITIKSVSGREGEYIAFYTSNFLDATFSVYLKIILWEPSHCRTSRR